MPRQIGWSQESNLLYNISMQLDRLAAVTAASAGGGGTITGGGAAGQVTFWNGATSITGSNNLFWDSTNSRLGIGTNTPSVSLSVPGQVLFGSTANGFNFSSNTLNTYGNIFISIASNRTLTFSDSGFTSNFLRIVRDTGNILINTGTDAGFRLDVNGTSRFQNDVQISTASGSYSLSIVNSVSSVPLYINSSGSATGGLEIANQSLRRLRILVTATNTTFEQSNQTGGFIFGANSTFSGDVSISGKLALTVVANRQTVNYSLVLADNGKLVEMNVGTANTLTVPPNSSIAFPIGTKIDIAQYGAGQTSIVPGLGVTVRSALGALKLAAQYSGASLVKIGTDEWYLFGDITV